MKKCAPHNRVMPVQEVKISDLKFDPDFVTDERLINTYVLLDRSKIKQALTRIPEQNITTGYYIRQPNGSSDHITNLKSENVSGLETAIRGGFRPVLDVYWNPHVPSGGGYVCADHETPLAAYRSLGIKLVPCRVLRPKPTPAAEAALWIENRGKVAYLEKAVPPAIESYASFAGTMGIGFAELIPLLTSICTEARQAIVGFHQDAGLGVHYHQMLHAILRRHERALDSILRLVQLNRVEHAAALTRLAYEAFLNFYIDWLSPEFFGKRLQFLAMIREAQNQDKSLHKNELKRLGNFTEFLENTSDKARVSPLGTMFHDIVYPPLSLVVHQSYAHIEGEASEFLEDDISEDGVEVNQLGRWLSFLTAALVVRVQNEVGARRA